MTRPAAIGWPSAGTTTSQTVLGLSSIALAAGPNSAPARSGWLYVFAASFFRAMSCSTGGVGADAVEPLPAEPVLPVDPVLPVEPAAPFDGVAGPAGGIGGVIAPGGRVPGG